MRIATLFPLCLSPALPTPDFLPGAGAEGGEEGRKFLTRVVGFQFEHRPERSTKY